MIYKIILLFWHFVWDYLNNLLLLYLLCFHKDSHFYTLEKLIPKKNHLQYSLRAHIESKPLIYSVLYTSWRNVILLKKKFQTLLLNLRITKYPSKNNNKPLPHQIWKDWKEVNRLTSCTSTTG